MIAKRVIISVMLGLLAAIAAPTHAFSQGFAGLGDTPLQGFSVPQPMPEFAFPRDHGPHPDFRIEWWYLTANLTDAQGRAYGIQWTLFRSALLPHEATGWASPQIWMGHAAVTSAQDHLFAERIGRGGTGQAGVIAQPFAAWIDNWTLRQVTKTDTDALSHLHVAAQGDTFSYALDLNADAPLVFHGSDGYSIKSANGQASYYYSQPRYEISGVLTLPSGPVSVTGQGWLDREWSSQPLAADQTGWDWFSLSPSDGSKLMGFRLRGGDGEFTSATWITPDGQVTALPDGALTLTPLDTAQVAGRDVPISWRVELPAADMDVTVRALNKQSWMGTSVPYWEGPVLFDGSHDGVGYLEMTGYE